MKEQIVNCKNCLYFIDMSKSENGVIDRKYVCHLHGSEALITDPITQCCVKDWVSVKLKNRINNLEELLD